MVECYGLFHDELKSGMLGAVGESLIDPGCELFLPDGLWHVTAKLDVVSTVQWDVKLKIALVAQNEGDFKLHTMDTSTISLTQGHDKNKNDHCLVNVSLMGLAAFSGTKSKRVNNVQVGIRNTYKEEYGWKLFKINHVRVLATRVDSYLFQPSGADKNA